MLSGKDLGTALADAMRKKGVNQPTVAAEFEISQPSVSEWIKYGRIAKKHIPHLVDWFADVVGPEHWGLPPIWRQDRPLSARALALARQYDAASEEARRKFDAAATLAGLPSLPEGVFMDPDASRPEYSLLGNSQSGALVGVPKNKPRRGRE